MYQNLLALHSVDASNQEVITVDDIYAITDSMDTLSVKKPTKRKAASATASDVETVDLQWPPQEEDFVIILEEQGWGLGSVQHYDSDQNSIHVQSLTSLKTRAKDDQGKTYWVYPDQEIVDDLTIGSFR